MKIQWYENISFSVSSDAECIAFNPTEHETTLFTFACFTNGQVVEAVQAKKKFNFAGEYEMADILMKGFEHVADQEIVYKVTADEITCAYFGAIQTMPEPKIFKELGENVDVLIVNMTGEFGAKKAKDLIEKVEPRIAILGGESRFFSEISGLMKVRMLEENTYVVKKSSGFEENTEVVLLAATTD